MRPVCLKCSTEYVPARNGVSVAYISDYTTSYHAGDRWECPCCGQQIVVGLARASTERPQGEVVATVDRRQHEHHREVHRAVSSRRGDTG